MAAGPEVQELSFPCQGCGAALQYAPGTTALKCPYCSRDHEMPATAQPIVERPLEELAVVPYTAGEGFGTVVRQFKCNRCNAFTTLPGAVMATRCAFCGSDVVVEVPPVAGMVRPESLVPFQVSKDQASARFADWIRGLWFRPSDLKRMASLAKIDGLYAPHFTYDANAFSRWSGWRGDYYTVTVGSGQNRRTERRVRWSYRSGVHQAFYDDELVCASRGLPEGILRKIYPYHLQGLVPYQPQYLAGFQAEAYQVDPRDGWKVAAGQMHQQEVAACTRLVGGDTQRDVQVHTTYADVRWKHLLLPAYVASYAYGGKTFRFMVNGQTGEVQGEAPISWLKVAAAVGAAVAGVLVLLKLAGAF